jgi:hypothetical protein
MGVVEQLAQSQERMNIPQRPENAVRRKLAVLGILMRLLAEIGERGAWEARKAPILLW